MTRNETTTRIISALILILILISAIYYGYLNLVIYIAVAIILFEWVKNTYKKPILLAAGILFLLFALKDFLQHGNEIYIIFSIIIASFIDILAYFSGKYFPNLFLNGKKLAPKISPKKTYTGFIVPIMISYATIIAIMYFKGGKVNIPLATILAFAVNIGAVSGDLLLSKIKRTLGIKDFSNLIPGHGGILDRLDSSLALMFIYNIAILFKA